MDGLLPAAMLRADPPSQVAGAKSVVTGLALILDIVPFCSYVRVQLLQGVAFAGSVPSTTRTACLAAAIRWLGEADQLCCCPAGQLVQSQKICLLIRILVF